MQPNTPQVMPTNIPTGSSFGRPSKKPLIVAILMTVLFVLTLVFAIWAFVGKVDNQSNLDQKIAAANAVAVKAAEEAKEVDFAEREKSPYRRYSGPSTYGSISFDYPRTWSVYVEEKASGTVLDVYAHPNILPSFSSGQAYAFRMEVIADSYDNQLSGYSKDAAEGLVTVGSFRLAKLPDVLGAKVTGEIVRGRQGALVLLPQRDKTIAVWTEAPDYIRDFETLIASFSFVP